MNHIILDTLKWFLLPLGFIHYAIVFLRNKLYDYGVLSKKTLPVPVVAIGNIQLGGTGKTPFVAELIRRLELRGLVVGILTRGYRRSGTTPLVVAADAPNTAVSEIGDEPKMLLQHLKNGVIGVGANRYEAAQAILKDHTVDVLLMDDGFQHRQLNRELDICLIDVSRWRQHPFLFPFSYLRDIKGALKRAKFVILNKWSGEKDLMRIEAEVKSLASAAIVKRGQYRIIGLRPLAGQREELNEAVLSGEKIFVVSGIANPEHFRRSLAGANDNIVGYRDFADHHSYTKANVEEIFSAAREADASMIVVTEKDGVKLRPLLKGVEPEPSFFEVLIQFELPGIEDVVQAVLTLVGAAKR